MMFRAYPATRVVNFTCAICNKPGRRKTLKVECTVNPFNLDESGRVLTPKEVAQQSRDKLAVMVSEFMAKPVCASCHGELSYADAKALTSERLTILGDRA